MHPLSRRVSGTLVVPAWFPAHICPETDNPASGDQAVLAGHIGTSNEAGGNTLTASTARRNPLLRLQGPLPAGYTDASPDALADRIRVAKETLGDSLLILGHHYQRQEVIDWADATGDSYGLARIASASDARHIVFCGVHFMAESADVLTSDEQAVMLPDLNAGCSMADMADLESVEEAWDEIAKVTDIDRVVPITYMNSSAALKAFVGEKGGAVCTSTNARAVLDWALARGDQVLFFPDQHLGRNTGYAMGFTEDDMRVWNPRLELGGLEEADVKDSTFLLWKGHCSVHQRFRPHHIDEARRDHPGVIVVVHPECARDVVEMADQVGSTDFIIKAVEAAPPGSTIAVGTEIHLVQRLAAQAAADNKTVFSLDPLICPCSTMFRIDAAHLCWVLEELIAGRVVNQIAVPNETAKWARVALERMLAIT